MVRSVSSQLKFNYNRVPLSEKNTFWSSQPKISLKIVPVSPNKVGLCSPALCFKTIFMVFKRFSYLGKIWNVNYKLDGFFEKWSLARSGQNINTYPCKYICWLQAKLVKHYPNKIFIQKIKLSTHWANLGLSERRFASKSLHTFFFLLITCFQFPID